MSHYKHGTLYGTLSSFPIFFYITAPIQMVLLYATLGTYWTSLPAFQYIFAIIKEINGTKNKIPIGLKWTLHTLRVPKHTGFVWWLYADRVDCSTVNIWTVRRMQCVKYSSILSFILLFQKSNNFFFYTTRLILICIGMTVCCNINMIFFNRYYRSIRKLDDICRPPLPLSHTIVMTCTVYVLHAYQISYWSHT